MQAAATTWVGPTARRRCAVDSRTHTRAASTLTPYRCAACRTHSATHSPSKHDLQLHPAHSSCWRGMLLTAEAAHCMSVVRSSVLYIKTSAPCTCMLFCGWCVHAGQV